MIRTPTITPKTQSEGYKWGYDDGRRDRLRGQRDRYPYGDLVHGKGYEHGYRAGYRAAIVKTEDRA